MSKQANRNKPIVLGLAMAMVAISYADRSCVAAAGPFIRDALKLSNSQLGLAFTAFSIGYSLFEVPAGRFADRVGPRRSLARIVVGWSIMTALTGAAVGVRSLVAIRLVFGACEAGTYPTLARLYSDMLRPEQRGKAIGLAMALATVSGALVQPLIVLLITAFGWRIAFVCMGVIGVVWTVAWLAVPWSSVSAQEVEEATSSRGHVDWSKVVRHRVLWSRCISYAATLFGMYVFHTWVPSYLLSLDGMEGAQVGWLSGLAALGLGVGIALGGYLDDHVRRRRQVWWSKTGPAVAMLTAAALVAIATSTRNGPTVVLLLGLAGCASGLTVATSWTSCAEIEPRAAGGVCGILNTFGNLGGALTGITIGSVLDRTGSWSLAMMTVSGAFGLAALAWLVAPHRAPLGQEPQDGTLPAEALVAQPSQVD